MMEGFKLWLHEAEAPDARILQHIKIPLPSVEQSHDFDCGAAALRSIASYYKVGPEDEGDFIKAVKADNKDGTHPKDIMKAAKAFGLKVIAKEHMTINELKSYIDKERPVICDIQAWGKPKNYHKRNDGHYVVAIGYDDTSIYFEDPVLKGRRGRLPFEDFNKRWRDKESKQEHTDHLGIVIWHGTPDTDSHYLLKSTKIK